jgi:fibronectin type 3 domain-containing protein
MGTVDLANLAAYLRQIDATETSAPESSQDNSSPSIPTSFSAQLQNGYVDLSWAASTDNVGVAGYYVYRSTDGTQGPIVATVSTTAWLDTTVTEGVAYTYAVAAFDAAGNISARSTSSSQTPYLPPTKPMNLVWTQVGNYPQLSWSPSTDNVAVAGYIIYRSDGAKSMVGPQVGQTSSTTWLDTSVKPGQYVYTVAAIDTAGYLSPTSSYRKVVLKK